MPRIPQYVGQVDLPSSMPAAKLPYVLPSGAGALAQGLQQIGGAASEYAAAENRYLAAQARLEKKLRDEEIANDHEQKQEQYKVDYATRESELLQQGMYPEQVRTAMGEFSQQRIAQLSDELRYPDSAALFQRKMRGPVATNAVQTIHKTDALRTNMLQATSGLQLERYANTAVTGATEVERQAAFDAGLSKIHENVRKQIYSGEQGNAETRKFLKNVEKGTVLRDFADPKLQPTVLQWLAEGRYQHIEPHEQFALYESLSRRQREEEERRRTEQQRARVEHVNTVTKDVQDHLMGLRYEQAMSVMAENRDYFTGAEYQLWTDRITQASVLKEVPEKPKQTDSEAGMRLRRMVYGAMNEKELVTARQAVLEADAQGLLKDTDADKWLNDIQGTLISFRNRREDKGLDAYHRERSEVKDLIKTDLKVTSGLQALEAQAQAVEGMALADLERNAPAARPGAEAPKAWYNRQKSFYISHINQAATARLNEIELAPGVPQLLKMQGNTAAQEAAKRDRSMFRNEADFYDAVKLVREHQLIRQEQNRLRSITGQPGAGVGQGGGPTQPTAPPGQSRLGR